MNGWQWIPRSLRRQVTIWEGEPSAWSCRLGHVASLDVLNALEGHNRFLHTPGTLHVPLATSDRPPVGMGLVHVTAVFCMVDGGKAYVARSRSDSKLVNRELLAVMRNALRQVGAVLETPLQKCTVVSCRGH